MGHALNKILKDIITRYKSMLGYYAPYVPGMDLYLVIISLRILFKAWPMCKLPFAYGGPSCKINEIRC
jgi:isoleucyl-tRNA synthetase